MSAATSSVTTPLLQGQNAIQGLAPTRAGPQRERMDLNQRIQALELELADLRNESSTLMSKRAVLRLCCFPYHAAVICAFIPIAPLLTCSLINCGGDWLDRICEGSMGIFCRVCWWCEKEVSYPEDPETRVARYFPDILCGIDTPVDPMEGSECCGINTTMCCCCCADYCAGFVDSRVKLMPRGPQSRKEELESIASLSQKATHVYEAFESLTREGRFTIHPETDVRQSFAVPESLMGIVTEYEYEVPAPRDERMIEIPLSEDDQQMMQIPLPKGHRMTAEEIVVYRQQEWRKAEFRKRELEKAMAKMKATCAEEGVKLPMGLKV